jgi:ribosomal protein S18 acetylase RimI-like enzyme
MESAFVCTEHDNTAAQQLYQAVGFSIRNTDFDYFKT